MYSRAPPPRLSIRRDSCAPHSKTERRSFGRRAGPGTPSWTRCGNPSPTSSRREGRIAAEGVSFGERTAPPSSLRLVLHLQESIQEGGPVEGPTTLAKTRLQPYINRYNHICVFAYHSMGRYVPVWSSAHHMPSSSSRCSAEELARAKSERARYESPVRVILASRGGDVHVRPARL